MLRLVVEADGGDGSPAHEYGLESHHLKPLHSTPASISGCDAYAVGIRRALLVCSWKQSWNGTPCLSLGTPKRDFARLEVESREGRKQGG